jgi:hypothetical protein
MNARQKLLHLGGSAQCLPAIATLKALQAGKALGGNSIVGSNLLRKLEK